MTDKPFVSLPTTFAREATTTVVPLPRAPQPVSKNIFEPDDDEDAELSMPFHLSTTVLMKSADALDEGAFQMLGPAFFNQHDMPGFQKLHAVKILSAYPIYLFMRAVHDNDIPRVVELMRDKGPQIRARMNDPSFFYFTGSSDACFVTPGHVVRSFDMLYFLHKRCGMRFDLPDSEGRLPQLYWARHSRDPLMFAFGERMLNMDMHRGGVGANRHGHGPDMPIWEAMEFQNPLAAKGLSICERGGINSPRERIAGLTPLIAQAAFTSESMIAKKPVAMRALKTLWNLARSPLLDWDRADAHHHTVNDLGLHNTVWRVLDRAKARPFDLGLMAKMP